jgi:catechol 2,3-dioxygenase-like lactoylglutathione lyase family enzyme
MELHTLAFDNIGIAVTDLTAARLFYERLGFAAEYGDDRSTSVTCGSARLYLFTGASGVPRPQRGLDMVESPPGIDHISFAVSDVDAAAGALQSCGISLESGPINQPWGRRTITVLDSDGNRLWFLGPIG